MNNGKAAFLEFHDVYIDPAGFAAHRKPGKFPDGTMFVKELASVGAKSVASGNGYFRGEFIGVATAVNDSKRFAILKIFVVAEGGNFTITCRRKECLELSIFELADFRMFVDHELQLVFVGLAVTVAINRSPSKWLYRIYLPESLRNSPALFVTVGYFSVLTTITE
jgi:hypothetical protein